MERAFLITPFSPESAGGEEPGVFQAVQHAVRSASERAGVDLIHPAEISRAGVIMDHVAEGIESADVVLAVVTGRNPNVYYELGLSRRPAILIAADAELPFDIRHLRCLTYGASGELETLSARVEAAIRETLAVAPTIDVALADYFRAVRAYAARLPYLSLKLTFGSDVLFVPPGIARLANGASQSETAATGEVLSIGQALRESKGQMALFVGEAGAGKSMLLRHVARHAWSRPEEIGLDRPHLPMLLSPEWLVNVEGAAVGDRLWNALSRSGELTLLQRPPENFFVDWPRRLHVPWLLMFDGIDQVAGVEREKFLRWLQDVAAALKDYGRHRFLLTSRPGEVAPIDKEWAAYRLLPLEEEDQKLLARHLLDHGADQFLRQLMGPRGTALRTNPLMLTIAAEVYATDGNLPERKAELYDRYIMLLLHEAKRRGLTEALGEDLSDAAFDGLKQIAWEMSERPEERSVKWLSERVAAFLQEGLHLPPLKVSAAGRRFIDVLGRRSGLLLVRGEFTAWSHNSFRDYLAARHFADRCGPDDEAGRKVVETWEKSRNFALMLVNIWSGDGLDVSEVVRSIWHANTEGFIVAATAVSEGARVSRNIGDGVHAMLRTHVARSGFYGVISTSPNAVLLLQHPVPRRWDTDGIKQLIRDSSADRWVKQVAAAALYDLGRIEDLAQLGREPGLDAAVRILVAREIGRLPNQRAAVAEMLREIGLDRTLNLEDRQMTAEALMDLELPDEAASVMAALVRSPGLIRLYGLSYIAKLGLLRRVNELSALAQDPYVDEILRTRIVETLAKLGGNDALLAVVMNERANWDARIAAAASLRPEQRSAALPVLLAVIVWGSTTPELSIPEAERGSFQITDDLTLTEKAVAALGSLNFLQELKSLLADETLHSRLRVAAAASLLQAERDATAMEFLFSMVQTREATDDSARSDSRLAAIKALGKLSLPETAAAALVIARDEKEDWKTRKAAVDALKESKSLESLRMVVRDERVDDDVRLDAAEALKDANDEEGIRFVALNGNWAFARIPAIESLARLGHVEDARAMLSELARQTDLNDFDAKQVARTIEEIDSGAVLLSVIHDEAVPDDIRVGAVRQLGFQHGTKAVVGLAREISLSPPVRLAAAAIAAASGDAEPAMAMVRDARADDDFRRDAVWSMAQEPTANALLDLLRHPDCEEPLRLTAAVAFASVAPFEKVMDLVTDATLSRRIRSAAPMGLTMGLKDRERQDDLRRLAVHPDVEPGVRATCAFALGETGDTASAVQILRGITSAPSNDAESRIAAAEFLASFGGVNEAASVLLDLVSQSEVPVDSRAAAVLKLQKLERTDEYRVGLLGLVRDTTIELEVRLSMIGALAEIDAVDDLAALARDAAVEVELREGAISGLESEERFEDLLNLVHEVGLEMRVRSTAVHALARSSRNEELLALACDIQLNADLRVLAAGRLTEAPFQERASAVLHQIGLDDGIEGVTRLLAGMFLRQTGQTERATEVLLALVRYPQKEPAVISDPIELLGKMDRLDDVAAIARDNNLPGWTRAKAAGVLTEHDRDEEGIDLLVTLVRDPAQDTEMRVSLLSSLGEAGDIRALEGLEALAAETTDDSVRSAVVDAIVRIREHNGSAGK